MLRSIRHENLHHDIFTPRTYQVELLDKALKRNTIVCLSNSSGKTFIAVLLIKELAHQVRQHKCKDVDTKTVFLVEKGSFVKQHAHVIRLHTDVNVGEYDDWNKIQTWTVQRWKKEVDEHSVMVMTAQIFKEVLTQECIISMIQINTLIIDECQHVISDGHPLAYIMDVYKNSPVSKKPRVLGLTSSVLKNNKCKTPAELEDRLNALETALDSTAETASDVMLTASTNTKPQEITIDCEKYVDETGLEEKFENILESALYFLENCNIKNEESEEQSPTEIPMTCVKEVLNILHILGPWCAGRVAQALVKQLEKVLEHERREWPRRLLQFTRTQMRLIDKVLSDVFDHEVLCLEDFLKFMTPKVHELRKVLHGYKPEDNFMIIGDDPLDVANDSDGDMSDFSDGDDPNNMDNKELHYVAVKKKPEGQESDEEKDETLYGLVFVERRHTAFALNKLIEELCIWDPDIFFIKNHCITGHGVNRRGKSKGESEVLFKQQEDIIRKFRQREYNLLITTCVLEEGVDVPKCNLIIRFFLPKNYRSYTQSKGRARAPNAKYYMLIDEPSLESFHEDLKVFRGFEKLLCQKLRESEKEEMHAAMTPSEVDKLLPPYIPNAEDDDSKVTLSSAITLVNRYCAKLPSDAFTHLVPKITVQEKEGSNGVKLLSAILQLPINSPVKAPIQGEFMPSSKLALKAVALKTCEVLHKQGELDNHFMPIGKEMIRYEDEDNEWEETEASGQARPGTTKRKQYYLKRIPQALVGQPKPAKPCFLYVFNMTLTCPISEEQNTRGRKIHAPEDTSRGFGIISEQRMPLVPYFPVFTRSGEVTVAIDLVCSDLVLTSQEYRRLSSFHLFVFSKVLRLEKDPMIFRPHEAASSYIVLPLTIGETLKDVAIDWDFITLIEECPMKESRRKFIFETKQEKEQFEFRIEDFEDAVVMPSYRNIDQPQYFYVAEIREDLTPKSPFPSPELFDTFENYYNSKYGLSVTNLKQPLLDVDHTSARLNLLTPRYMNQKGVALPTSSAETRRAKRENLQQKQILVPELCDIHPFPASLWRKAVCIPAILYRLNYLLIAEEIRIMISEKAHIGIVKLDQDHRFPKVEFVFPSLDEDDNKESTVKRESNVESQIEHETKSQKEVDGLTDSSKKSTERSHDILPENVPSSENSQNEDDSAKNQDKSDSKPESNNKMVDGVDSKQEREYGLNQENDNLEKDDNVTTVDQSNIPVSNQQAEQGGHNRENISENTSHLEEKMSGENKNHKIEVHNINVPEAVCNGLSEDDSQHMLISSNTENTSAVNKNTFQESQKDEVISTENILNQNNIESKSENSEVIRCKCNSNKLYNCDCENAINDTNEINNLLNSENGSESSQSCEVVEKEFKKEEHNEKAAMSTDQCISCSLSDSLLGSCTISHTATTTHQTECDQLPGDAQQLESCDTDSTQFCMCIGNNKESCNSHNIGNSTTSIVSSLSNSTQTPVIPNRCDSNTQKLFQQTSEMLPEQNIKSTKEDVNIGKSVNSSEGQEKIKGDINGGKNDSVDTLEGIQDKNFLNTEHDYTPRITFDDECVDLGNFVGPSPSILLQTLTMSNANDFFNLERLETIGDSFLKFAITVYLYCTYPGIHEGKLSYLRSKQVSNYNLYRLGKKKGFPECMVASKFEPSENWLPPGFIVKREGAFKGLEVYVAPTANINARSTGAKVIELDEDGNPIVERYGTEDGDDDFAIGQWAYGSKDENTVQNGKSDRHAHSSWREDILKLMNKSNTGVDDENKPADKDSNEKQVPSSQKSAIADEDEKMDHLSSNSENGKNKWTVTSNPFINPQAMFNRELEECTLEEDNENNQSGVEFKTLIPYNLQTQHSLPDKSIADCVEALIGCYLITCCQRAALEFMAWLGLKVLPMREDFVSEEQKKSTPFGLFEKPQSPLLMHVPDVNQKLNFFLDGYDALEESIQYKFNDRSYLLQAFTHASYHYNNITDCYQRLEFLGDAILDYVITRHLFEDSKKHSPGILTDLRSALVNNNIFAALAVKWNFHKYFRAVSPHLFTVINKFVQWQKERDDEITLEDEMDDDDKEEEDIEIPKALGDIFESVAGAVYLDSGLSLDVTWRVYYRIMKPYIDAFTAKIPKSPVRELLEMEPETAKFERPERTMDGKIRVTVTVVGKGSFSGVGRNYRIAKSAAARRALKYVKLFNFEMTKLEQRNAELLTSLVGAE